MKRILLLILTALFLIGCGGSSTGPKETPIECHPEWEIQYLGELSDGRLEYHIVATDVYASKNDEPFCFYGDMDVAILGAVSQSATWEYERKAIWLAIYYWDLESDIQVSYDGH